MHWFVLLSQTCPPAHWLDDVQAPAGSAPQVPAHPVPPSAWLHKSPLTHSVSVMQLPPAATVPVNIETQAAGVLESDSVQGIAAK